jgi:hypothetical protein
MKWLFSRHDGIRPRSPDLGWQCFTCTCAHTKALATSGSIPEVTTWMSHGTNLTLQRVMFSFFLFHLHNQVLLRNLVVTELPRSIMESQKPLYLSGFFLLFIKKKAIVPRTVICVEETAVSKTRFCLLQTQHNMSTEAFLQRMEMDLLPCTVYTGKAAFLWGLSTGHQCHCSSADFMILGHGIPPLPHPHNWKTTHRD